MRYFIAVLIVMLVALSSGGARALTAGELLDACDSQGEEAEFCAGYVVGFVSGIAAADKFEELVCLPENATGKQITLVILKYIRSLPEIHHVNAAAVAVSSLSQAFPCEGR